MNIIQMTAKVLIVMPILVLLSACAGTRPDLPDYDMLLKEDTGQNGRACVRQTDINGFGILADDVVSISTRGNRRYYLATTLFRCNSLNATFAAGFQGSFTEICGGGMDNIVTKDESCPIDSIFEFESREAAFAAYSEAEQIRSNLRAEAKKNAE